MVTHGSFIESRIKLIISIIITTNYCNRKSKVRLECIVQSVLIKIDVMKKRNRMLFLGSILFEVAFIYTGLYGFTFLAGVLLGELLFNMFIIKSEKKQQPINDSWSSQFLVNKEEIKNQQNEER